jgi:hypothetical protein
MSTVKMITIFAMPAFDDKSERPTPSNPDGFRCDFPQREKARVAGTALRIPNSIPADT